MKWLRKSPPPRFTFQTKVLAELGKILEQESRKRKSLGLKHKEKVKEREIQVEEDKRKEEFRAFYGRLDSEGQRMFLEAAFEGESEAIRS